jgi:hypothetical protein
MDPGSNEYCEQGERQERYRQRRRSQPLSPPQSRVDTLVNRLRDSPATLLGLLALGNLLSMLDAFLTLRLLPLGFVEANPVMRALVHADPARATIVKMLIILLASVGIWVLRRHRAAAEAAVFLVAVYGIVVLYELAGLLRFG